MRHIHADHMIAAANDTSIEWQAVGPLSREWIYTGKSGEFMFYPDSQYRQRPQPHPHQAMIDQAAADTLIEWQHSSQGSDWSDCLHLSGPQWHIGFNYRQKPAEPKMVDMWQWVYRGKKNSSVLITVAFFAMQTEAQNFVGGMHEILWRQEGSKITVPEVSQ
jgi:hypothetical protein